MAIKRKCNYCNKEVEGFSEKHVEYLLNMHIIGKHSDIIKIRKA